MNSIFTTGIKIKIPLSYAMELTHSNKYILYYFDTHPVPNDRYQVITYPLSNILSTLYKVSTVYPLSFKFCLKSLQKPIFIPMHL